MEETIWICRHGKTEWNLEHRKQGHKDSPLSDQGIKQANTLAKLFRNMYGELFSSPLGRVLRTSQIICKDNPHLVLHTDDHLREISFGILEGLTPNEIREQHPNVIDAFNHDPFNKGFPNGESFRDLKNRASEFLENLTQFETDKIIIVAHEDINRILLTLLLDLELDAAIYISHPNHIIYKIIGNTVECLHIDGSHISDTLQQ